jgi:hypothetical protein
MQSLTDTLLCCNQEVLPLDFLSLVITLVVADRRGESVAD